MKQKFDTLKWQTFKQKARNFIRLSKITQIKNYKNVYFLVFSSSVNWVAVGLTRDTQFFVWIRNRAINYMKWSQIIKCILKSQKISKNHSTDWLEIKQLKYKNSIKLDNINLHKQNVTLHWWGFILNLNWEFISTLLLKINLNLKKN